MQKLAEDMIISSSSDDEYSCSLSKETNAEIAREEVGPDMGDQRSSDEADAVKWEVLDILDHFVDKDGVKSYRVKWKKDEGEETWSEEENWVIATKMECTELVDIYESKLREEHKNKKQLLSKKDLEARRIREMREKTKLRIADDKDICTSSDESIERSQKRKIENDQRTRILQKSRTRRKSHYWSSSSSDSNSRSPERCSSRKATINKSAPTTFNRGSDDIAGTSSNSSTKPTPTVHLLDNRPSTSRSGGSHSKKVRPKANLSNTNTEDYGGRYEKQNVDRKTHHNTTSSVFEDSVSYSDLPRLDARSKVQMSSLPHITAAKAHHDTTSSVFEDLASYSNLPIHDAKSNDQMSSSSHIVAVNSSERGCSGAVTNELDVASATLSCQNSTVVHGKQDGLDHSDNRQNREASVGSQTDSISAQLPEMFVESASGSNEENRSSAEPNISDETVAEWTDQWSAEAESGQTKALERNLKPHQCLLYQKNNDPQKYGRCLFLFLVDNELKGDYIYFPFTGQYALLYRQLLDAFMRHVRDLGICYELHLQKEKEAFQKKKLRQVKAEL